MHGQRLARNGRETKLEAFANRFLVSEAGFGASEPVDCSMFLEGFRGVGECNCCMYLYA